MKSKSLEEKCLCKDCEYRFECFTQEKLFSDALYQALYEAFMAEGMNKDEALVRMIEELRAQLNKSTWGYTFVDGGSSTFTTPNYFSADVTGAAAPADSPYFTSTTSDTYTYKSLVDGKEFKLSCKES